MWHLDIPKTRQYDNGKVEVIARNSAGEAVAVTDLNVKPRQDDYRNVLKNSPRRKSLLLFYQHFEVFIFLLGEWGKMISSLSGMIGIQRMTGDVVDTG